MKTPRIKVKMNYGIEKEHLELQLLSVVELSTAWKIYIQLLFWSVLKTPPHSRLQRHCLEKNRNPLSLLGTWNTKEKTDSLTFLHKGLVFLLIKKAGGWLGASPDGRVDDGKHGTGCVEIKALAGNWDSSINDILTLRKGNFCLHKDEATSELALKTTHIYYNQCQLQLYVGRDRFNWCDFVLSTRRDIFVQRIFLNKEWVEKNIPELENFYDSFVLKKLVV